MKDKKLHPDLKIFGSDHILDVIGEIVEYNSYLIRLIKEVKELNDIDMINKLYKFINKQHKELEIFLADFVDEIEDKEVDKIVGKVNDEK